MGGKTDERGRGLTVLVLKQRARRRKSAGAIGFLKNQLGTKKGRRRKKGEYRDRRSTVC